MLRALPSPVLKSPKGGEYRVALGSCLPVLTGKTFDLISGVHPLFQFTPVVSHSAGTTVWLPLPAGSGRLLVGPPRAFPSSGWTGPTPSATPRAAPDHPGGPLLISPRFTVLPKNSKHQLSSPTGVRLRHGVTRRGWTEGESVPRHPGRCVPANASFSALNTLGFFWELS